MITDEEGKVVAEVKKVLSIIKKLLLLGIIEGEKSRKSIVAGFKDLSIDQDQLNKDQQQEINTLLDAYSNIKYKEQLDDFLNLYFAANIPHQAENIVAAEKQLNALVKITRVFYKGELEKLYDTEENFVQEIKNYISLLKIEEGFKKILESFDRSNYIDPQLLSMIAINSDELNSWHKKLLAFDIKYKNGSSMPSQPNNSKISLFFDHEKEHYDICISKSYLKELDETRNKLPAKPPINNNNPPQQETNDQQENHYSYSQCFMYGMFFIGIAAPLTVIPLIKKIYAQPKVRV